MRFKEFLNEMHIRPDGVVVRHNGKSIKDLFPTLCERETTDSIIITGDMTVAFDDLVGCPKSVSGDFRVSGVSLISLKGFPTYVGGDIFLGSNHLENFEGLPKKINCTLVYSGNPITSLKGCPEDLNGLYIVNCRSLNTFNGHTIKNMNGTAIFLGETHITSGVMSLLKIKGLQAVSSNMRSNPWVDLFNALLKKNIDQIDLVDAFTDAGLEEYL